MTEEVSLHCEVIYKKVSIQFNLLLIHLIFMLYTLHFYILLNIADRDYSLTDRYSHAYKQGRPQGCMVSFECVSSCVINI